MKTLLLLTVTLLLTTGCTMFNEAYNPWYQVRQKCEKFGNDWAGMSAYQQRMCERNGWDKT